MVKNIKLDTYFFKEYEKIVEKNTYSAYVPNGNKGIWSIASYNEGKKKKNSDSEKINLAQIGVQKTIKKYFENNDFSIENMEQIVKNSSKKTIFEKINLEKGIENLEKTESENSYSQLNIMINKDNLIVGNKGKTAFILYRENKILEKISGEKIKNIRLEKNDYLLAGSPEFWEVIDENELTEIHIDKKSKESVERNLSEKIKKVEKKINKVIPFFSIFVEEIENIEENNLEDMENRKDNNHEKIFSKYLFLAIVFIFMFVSVGKNIQKNHLKSSKNPVIKNKVSNKNFIINNFIKRNLSIVKKVKNDDFEKVKIKFGNDSFENEEIKKETKIEKEKEEKTKFKNNFKRNIENMIISKNENTSNKTEKHKNVKKSKYKRIRNKNLYVESKSFRNEKNNKISELEKEIERNWEILGRDRNGNVLG